VCAEGKDLKVRFADIGCGFGGLIGTCLWQEFADSPWRVLGFDAPYLIRTMAVEYQIASLLFGSFYLINSFYFSLLLGGGYNTLSSFYLSLLLAVIIISDDRFVELAVQLSPLFPESLMVGMELRDKVCFYIHVSWIG
jgi:hypothetical protein